MKIYSILIIVIISHFYYVAFSKSIDTRNDLNFIVLESTTFFEIVGVGDLYLYREPEVISLNLNSIIYILFQSKYLTCWASLIKREYEPTR